ncbi:MAG TPA: ATPase, T2SS/T4P/T4SS family, partial [bacterium]|nr:ATPase, T2SS/T4P/T4SS family [bacterium]
MIGTKKRLGDLLLEAGLISEDQLKKALLAQKLSNDRLGAIFKKMGYISEETLLSFLSKQLKIPILNLKELTPKKELAQYIPVKLAEENKVAPVKLENDILTIAMADPLNVFVIDEIHTLTKLEIEIGVAAESEIMEFLNAIYYSKADNVSALELTEFDENQLAQNNKIVTAIDSPIVKLVNDIITQSVRKGASDIHFDAQKTGINIRCRIDGIMNELSALHDKYKPLITSRLKILANLDIAEKRIPQDGRITMNIDGRDIDIRVSTLPTIYGERIVLRILDKSNLLRGINDLGFS